VSGPERITLAMTGASGAQYGLRLLDCLVREDREVHFLISKAAQLVMATETDVTLPPKPQSMQAFLSEYTGAQAGGITSAPSHPRRGTAAGIARAFEGPAERWRAGSLGQGLA